MVAVLPSAMFDWQAELSSTVPVPVASTATPDPNLALAMVAHNTPTPTAIPRPSFAQALRGSKVTYADPLPTHVILGETLSIHITKDAYFRGLAACRTNLRGRLMLNKGDKPYSSKDIFAKFQSIWKVSGPWSLLSLGRGFDEFTFASQEDLRKVWAVGTVNLMPRVL